MEAQVCSLEESVLVVFYNGCVLLWTFLFAQNHNQNPCTLAEGSHVHIHNETVSSFDILNISHCFQLNIADYLHDFHGS